MITGERTKDVEVLGVRPSFSGWVKPSRFKAFSFNETNSAFAGPLTQESITTITSVDGKEDVYAVTDDLKILGTKFTELKDRTFEPAPSDLWWDYDYPFKLNDEGVICSETEGSFLYRGRNLKEPFGESNIGPAIIKNPLYFRDSYLSIIETNWMHLGDEHNEKQLHRLDISFHKNSTGKLWGYVKSDDGVVKGQYKGDIEEHMKVFTNIRGRRFKVRLLICSHNKHPWALREIAVGHLRGKSF